jgi:hypothetical protein
MKNKKHSKIIGDYDKQKSKHLENLATQILKADEKIQKLKEKSINPDILKLF